MNISLSIDAIQPRQLEDNDTVKVTWTLTVGETFEGRAVLVCLLTDDARLVLADPKNPEASPEIAVAVSPGQKISRTTAVLVQKRKGLVEEQSRDGSGSPFYLLGRVRNEQDVLAAAAGIELEMAGLARRTTHRIFV